MKAEEKEIRNIERIMDDYKSDLEMLEQDYFVVKSDKSKRVIADVIFRVKQHMLNLEFKLWKMKR